MANSFQIDIITPVENINIGTSEYLRAPNLDGLFGVQARHVSSIISVGAGEIKITQNGKEKFYSTTGGYADVKPEGVVLILETFTLEDKIQEKPLSIAAAPISPSFLNAINATWKSIKSCFFLILPIASSHAF